MNYCRGCGHERLMHDSWGCKSCSRCAISIIYMTKLFADEDNKKAEEEVIKAAEIKVAAADRVEESRLKALYNRILAEREQRIT